MFSGSFLELPTSGTEEVRNLWVESNIEKPGMWVIQLGQNDGSILLSELQCVGSISPQKVLMQAVDTVFTLSGHFCSELTNGSASEIEVVFTGTKNVLVLQGTLDLDSGNITCELQYWGEAEEVEVTVKVNGVTQLSSSKVLFYNPGDLIDPPIMLEFYFSSAEEIIFNFEPFLSMLGFTSSEVNITCLFLGG